MFSNLSREATPVRSLKRANEVMKNLALVGVFSLIVGLAGSDNTAVGALQLFVACELADEKDAVEQKTEDTQAEKPLKIESKEARQHAGKLCAVTFKVQKTKHSTKRKTYYLDSTTDFNLPENLGIKISEDVAAKLRQESSIEDPVTAYKDKTIRVVGKVILEEERTYIVIEKPEQIEILKETATTPAASEEKPKSGNSRNSAR